MESITNNFIPFIRERLDKPLENLSKEPEYKKLQKIFKTCDKELTTLLKDNEKDYINLLGSLQDIKSMELQRSYLIGFIDGIRLFEHLRTEK